ncbi:enoyl-CoA hydratase [Microbacterium pseudoresistens]|uniref:Enoyl-CoA hydratase/methylglutaconyl-CoA hydratase n=1 Tax=Microbacterium pseudoresistens TaxID=640634 RepID=A0A7Y9EUN7_9MICO|nr:enoyl-CoA hydratase/isomerase family protein [Microbacterium pseudoresistens]NYD54124.1 enoyl-CoA hydratase/methylglutaconyl-CoA hydratase [Microbacterium pseudoresistens]
MTEQLVTVETHGDVAIVTLNRPEKRNAVNRELSLQLRRAFVANEERKVVVLTGADPAFCAGVDLNERRDPKWSDTLGAEDAQHWLDTIEAIRRTPSVVIAAVNGAALGGGLTLVNAAELAIASGRARFGAPELSFGSFPALSGSSSLLTVAPKHAAELILTAEPVDAFTAQRWGIVNRVVSHDELILSARELADKIAAWPAPTLGFAKRAIHELAQRGWSAALNEGVLISALTRRLT